MFGSSYGSGGTPAPSGPSGIPGLLIGGLETEYCYSVPGTNLYQCFDTATGKVTYRYAPLFPGGPPLGPNNPGIGTFPEPVAPSPTLGPLPGRPPGPHPVPNGPSGPPNLTPGNPPSIPPQNGLPRLYPPGTGRPGFPFPSPQNPFPSWLFPPGSEQHELCRGLAPGPFRDWVERLARQSPELADAICAGIEGAIQEGTSSGLLVTPPIGYSECFHDGSKIEIISHTPYTERRTFPNGSQTVTEYPSGPTGGGGQIVSRSPPGTVDPPNCRPESPSTALPRREPRRGSIAITRGGGLFPNDVGSKLCDAQGNAYEWPGPGRNIVEVTGVDGSRIRWDISTRPHKIIQRWPAGWFTSPTCPNYELPRRGVIGRISELLPRVELPRIRIFPPGGIRGTARVVIRGIDIIGWIALIADILDQFGTEIEKCLKIVALWTRLANEMIEKLTAAKQSLLDKIAATNKILVNCPNLSALCRERIRLNQAALGNAVRRLNKLLEEARRERDRAVAWDCVTGSALGAPGIRGNYPRAEDLQLRLRAMAEAINEALAALSDWDEQIARLFKDCGCAAAGPAPVAEERRGGDDKFWRGEDMPRAEWK